MRVIVIGLDGAGFELIQPWLDKGKLPNLKSLINRGCFANLESCLPPTTSPSWKCYSTGKNPGKLGIFWWENVDLQNKRVIFGIPRVNESKEIWDFVGENGGKVGIINMPLTYPPKKVNGFLVSGQFGGEENFTYPEELKHKLRRDFNYKLTPGLLPFIQKKSEDVVREILEVINSRFAVARDMLNKHDLDFLHVTIFYINTLQHNFWNNKFTEEGWKLIDSNIGLLLEGLEDRYNIFIISDHGSNKIDQVFYINNWLAKEGYLKLSSSIKVSSLLYALRINKHSLGRIAHKLHIQGLTRLIPNRIKGFLASEAGTIDHSQKTYKVIWDKTKAIASGQGPVYVNLHGKQKETVREELLKKLGNLRNPKTGKKIARRVYRREEIYSGKYLPEAPDLIIDQDKGTHIRGGIGVGKKDVFEEPYGWKAENKREGIVIASGPDIRKGERLERVSILDLAPTILHIMNIPVPKDMDGRVLTEIFEQGSEPAKREVKYQEAEEYQTQLEKERIKQRLKIIQGSGKQR